MVSVIIPQRYVDVKTFLEQHATDPIQLKDLAALSQVSRPHLVREFTRHFHISPIDYLIQLRVRHALSLLRTTRLSITEISVLVGYDDPYYFSRLVHKRFGQSPRALRQALQQLSLTEFTVFLDQCDTNHGQIWLPILEQNFSRDAELDPRWRVYRSHELLQHAQPIPAPERVSIAQGMLRLLPEAWRTSICWGAVAPEEMKIEILAANTSHDGLNLGLSISGDTWHGYRLRLWGYTHVELETETSGYPEVLYRSQMQLDPHASDYAIAFWRSDDTLYAEVDGQRILEYKDPLPLYGPRHHSLGISRYFHTGSADLRQIRLLAKKIVGMVDSLEPGRRALANDRVTEAQAWFARIAQDTTADRVTVSTAQYLAALTLPDTDPAKERALQVIVDDLSHPLRLHALQRLLLFYIDADAVERITAYAPHFNATSIPHEYLRRINGRYAHLLRRVPQQRHVEILASLRQLAFTTLTLENIPLITLAPLHGMPLQELNLNISQVSDLTPLHSMALTSVSLRACPISDLRGLTGLPLTALWCGDTNITDLSPLAGMPLEVLDCSYNPIVDLRPLATISSLRSLIFNYANVQDLSPLHGLPLRVLDCMHNAVKNLAPLSGMRLEHLGISYNRITNLHPLKGLPLSQLACGGNQISTLLPLHGMPLAILDCHANRIVDLQPLRGMPLYKLDCHHNHIVDLTPLAGMPLRDLDCRHNKIASLSPLQGAPLYRLVCGDNPLTDLAPLRDAPLTYLDLGEIPVTPANAAVLQHWPLRILTCEVTNETALACAAHLPRLEYLNGHTTAHALPLLDDLRRAVTIWRQGAQCPPTLRVSLQSHAAPYSRGSCLALPLQAMLPDAVALCAWLGGALISPGTPEAFREIHHYLARVGKADGETFYLLGLQAGEDGELRWATGQPFVGHDHIGRHDVKNLLERTGTASFVLELAYEKTRWFVEKNAATTHHVVIQWPQAC